MDRQQSDSREIVKRGLDRLECGEEFDFKEFIKAFEEVLKAPHQPPT